MTNPATSDMLRGRIAAQRHMIAQCQNEIRQLESKLKTREERAMSDTQAKPVYREGDKVTFILDRADASNLNHGTNTSCYDNQIISHIPAPEPVVRWCNVYADKIGVMNHSEEIADEFFAEDRLAKLKITITGGDVTAEVVRVRK